MGLCAPFKSCLRARCEAAYAWLCQRRKDAGPYHDVWRVRERWETLRGSILKRLRAGLYRLSEHCYHLPGHGGCKGAVVAVREALANGRYPFVLRSDARGYYANIGHTQLLEQLRRHVDNPLSPHLRSLQRRPQAPHAKSKFLAKYLLDDPVRQCWRMLCRVVEFPPYMRPAAG
jgi:hypothetical protein